MQMCAKQLFLCYFQVFFPLHHNHSQVMPYFDENHLIISLKHIWDKCQVMASSLPTVETEPDSHLPTAVLRVWGISHISVNLKILSNVIWQVNLHEKFLPTWGRKLCNADDCSRVRFNWNVIQIATSSSL